MSDPEVPNTLDSLSVLANAIVDTVREPLIVLDQRLRVVVASRSFYSTFDSSEKATRGRKFYELDAVIWDIPELRALLEKIVPEHGVMEAFEVERDFPRIGHRSMLLNAARSFTKATATRPSCWVWKTSPSGGRRNTR